MTDLNTTRIKPGSIGRKPVLIGEGQTDCVEWWYGGFGDDIEQIAIHLRNADVAGIEIDWSDILAGDPPDWIRTWEYATCNPYCFRLEQAINGLPGVRVDTEIHDTAGPMSWVRYKVWVHEKCNEWVSSHISGVCYALEEWLEQYLDEYGQLRSSSDEETPPPALSEEPQVESPEPTGTSNSPLENEPSSTPPVESVESDSSERLIQMRHLGGFKKEQWVRSAEFLKNSGVGQNWFVSPRSPTSSPSSEPTTTEESGVPYYTADDLHPEHRAVIDEIFGSGPVLFTPVSPTSKKD
jgi:hypothetical protein